MKDDAIITAVQLDICDQASQVLPSHNLWCMACLNNPHYQHKVNTYGGTHYKVQEAVHVCKILCNS